ncbi:MAG TPA: lipid-binding SYLF domain-containing protein [Candidatus Sulfotelmatobacter sp.]|nr:lipid-binding SYLF domain-containing protein [Candidatus Sulfotelmatobacter sp.]
MKKLIIFSLIAIFGAAYARAGDSHTPRSDLVIRVETCEAILREFMAAPATSIPPAVWQKARGLMILSQFKAGFVFGVKGGYGVLMVKKPNGRWSLPVLIDASEASLGLQVGAKEVDTVCVIMDDATPRLLFTNRFNIGVDAKAVAGPSSAEAESDATRTFIAPVLVYSKSVGLFAGATVKAGRVERNDPANFILYNTSYTMPELLYSDWVTPPAEVQPLMSYVQQLSP